MILTTTSTFGQVENWDVYMAQYEKGPGSTLVNMSLKQSAPMTNLAFLLIASVTFKDCDKDGLPTKEQFDVLYTISDSTKSVVDKNVKNILAGTFTYQCERTDYYYVTDTLNIRERLNRLYSENFKTATIQLRMKEDKKWEGYLNFLYPNDETLEIMSDSKVVQALVEKGDKLEKPRKVDHWIYFKNEQDRHYFIGYLKTKNFKIESQAKIDKKVKPYSLQISRDDKVSLSEISQVTKELRQLAKKCNGDYDGWETFLITD
jgi:uncharacterized protein (TIGR01619 family)